MPESQVSQPIGGSVQSAPQNVESRRIDTAHPIRGRDNASPDSSNSPQQDDARSDNDLLDESQLQRHAEELAEKLQVRQRALDRRESQLNARLADAERDLRVSRLWIQERETELEEQARLLQQRSEDLEQRMASFSAAELASQRDISQLQQQLSTQCQEVRQREARTIDFQKRIEQQQVWLSEEAQRLESRRQQIASQERQVAEEKQLACGELDSAREELEAEKQRIARQAEAERTEQQRIRDQLEFERRQLVEKQTDQDRELAALKCELAGNHKHQLETLAGKRIQLENRSEALDRRQQLVEKLYEEAQGIHRQALETRLIAEQSWARLREAGVSDEYNDTVANLRLQLTEDYRLAEQSITQRKQQLQDIATRLSDREEQLRKKQEEIELWLDRRHQEIEEQAARLVARERELDRCDRKHAAERQQWQDERQRLLESIRGFEAGDRSSVTIDAPADQ